MIVEPHTTGSSTYSVHDSYRLRLVYFTYVFNPPHPVHIRLLGQIVAHLALSNSPETETATCLAAQL